ncbi:MULTISPECIES: amidase [Pseudomonas fluorescens group]|uniref:Amidase n=1 Tax=Pseudomonas fluorescens TaxID=294 RepID=A0AAE2Q370_PSEFL|nr:MULTISPECIES: amidase [Pseudomonas fluorescens group]MBA1429376.1 amidase [Pseudomonas orientalis]MBD8273043.1 amidase [Pseudomonas fluorescens]
MTSAFHFPEYDLLDGIALADMVRRKEVTPSELVRAAVQRIDERNGALNAVVHLLEDEAKSQCRLPVADGPLSGVPILIKDLLAEIEGCPTRNGSRLFEHYVAREDSQTIKRYRKAGLIFVGKTATPELGLHPYTESDATGITRNPWNLGLSPGGSSGGACAAVAAGMTPIAHGSDGGGSIRLPASHCGVFGLKPTRGRSPCGPHFSELWQGLVVEHAVSRSVRDSAAMLDILIAGNDDADAYRWPAPQESFVSSISNTPGRLRIAYTFQPFLGGELSADCRAAVESSLQLLADLGHDVVEAHPPLASADQLCEAMLTIVCGEMASLVENAGRMLNRVATYEDFEPGTWALARQGHIFKAVDLARMRELALHQGRIMSAFHEDYDVLVTPVVNQLPSPVGAFRLSPLEESLSRKVLGQWGQDWPLRLGNRLSQTSRQVMEYMGWSTPFNMSGQPAMSVPLFWNEAGLPMGTQFVAKMGNEALLLQLARSLEIARPWQHRRPPQGRQASRG